MRGRPVASVLALGVLSTALLAAGVAALRSPLRPPERATLLLGPVQVRGEGAPGDAVYLRVERGAITALSHAPPAGADARFAGATVTPGLIDAHIHLPPWFLPGQTDLFLTLLLLHGVTTIRETGSFGSRPFALGRAIERGARAGPRIVACGEVLDGDPPTWPLARRVRDVGEARAAVEAQVSRGARCIKVYGEIAPEVLDAIRAAAQARGVLVLGHLPHASGWNEARLDEIEHVCDPRCWEMTPRDVATLTATAPRAGVTHVPTLAVFEGQLRSYAYDEALRSPVARLMPRVWREVVWNPRYRPGGGHTSPAERQAREPGHRQMAQAVCAAVREMHDAGVPILAGTDPPNPFVVPGASLHEELRLLTRCGLSVSDAWRAATRDAAAALGLVGLGRIELGAPADLLVFRRDPTEDLTALDTLEAVIADGRLYLRGDLEAAHARQREALDRAWIDVPTVAIARAVAERLAAVP
jgi:imidazolonepropionase-like amidohydrolase